MTLLNLFRDCSTHVCDESATNCTDPMSPETPALAPAPPAIDAPALAATVPPTTAAPAMPAATAARDGAPRHSRARPHPGGTLSAVSGSASLARHPSTLRPWL